MNYYKCFIEINGWGTCYEENVQYMWAKDEAEARQIYCTENSFRKNKKGLTIELAEYNRGIVNTRTRNEVVTQTIWNSFLQLTEEIECVKKVTRYYCPTCKNQVTHIAKCCRYCGTELIFK
ncbi:MAG: hypothetical protein J6R47_01065 [Acholeplasmatales bacterium]|nr:hypothetical protein [Acholeplasmatales bacterium]